MFECDTKMYLKMFFLFELQTTTLDLSIFIYCFQEVQKSSHISKRSVMLLYC